MCLLTSHGRSYLIMSRPLRMLAWKRAEHSHVPVWDQKEIHVNAPLSPWHTEPSVPVQATLVHQRGHTMGLCPQPTPWAIPLLLSMLHRSFSPQTAQRWLSSERPKQRHKAMKPGAALMHVEEPRGKLVHCCTNQGLSLATALSPVKKNYTS